MAVRDKLYSPASLPPKKDLLYSLIGKLRWPLCRSKHSAEMENLCFGNPARYHSEWAHPAIIPLRCEIIQPVCSKVKEVTK